MAPQVRVKIAAVAALTCLCYAAEAQTARQVAQKAFGSVVLLVTEDSSGQLQSVATGFFVRPGVVATNAHAVDGASAGYVKIVGQRERHRVAGLLGLDTTHDLALLSVSTTSHETLPLADSGAVRVGDEVFAIGNPQGLEGTVSAGIVSGIRKIGQDSLLQITAAISPGSSGGPVMNASAEVVGIATATYRGGQNLNFAVPSVYLKSLLGRASGLIPLRSQSSAARSGGILSGLGSASLDGVVAEAFTWDNESQYSFTLRNRLQHPVKDIRCLVLFLDQAGAPIHSESVQVGLVIPAGLAKRITDSEPETKSDAKDPFFRAVLNAPTPLLVHYSVRPLTRSTRIRVLDFRVLPSEE
ncbi:MAG: trypsin-like peptidase domain-containing protein [Bryobacterales bacterium]|nr:trypsin-like peptidase domain-containing protein [Bryobacterales bacterium]